MSLQCEDIKQAIQTALPDAQVIVQCPREDGRHFETVVVSPSFNKKSIMQQHQMVMLPLHGFFKESLHAMKLKTLTPKQWEEHQKRDMI